MGKEKATANTVKDSTEKNQGKVSVKATVNIVSERVTTQKRKGLRLPLPILTQRSLKW